MEYSTNGKSGEEGVKSWNLETVLTGQLMYSRLICILQSSYRSFRGIIQRGNLLLIDLGERDRAFGTIMKLSWNFRSLEYGLFGGLKVSTGRGLLCKFNSGTFTEVLMQVYGIYSMISAWGDVDRSLWTIMSVVHFPLEMHRREAVSKMSTVKGHRELNFRMEE